MLTTVSGLLPVILISFALFSWKRTACLYCGSKSSFLPLWCRVKMVGTRRGNQKKDSCVPQNWQCKPMLQWLFPPMLLWLDVHVCVCVCFSLWVCLSVCSYLCLCISVFLCMSVWFGHGCVGPGQDLQSTSYPEEKKAVGKCPELLRER